MSSFSTRKEMDRDIASNVLVEYTEDNGHFSSTSVDGVLEVARQVMCRTNTGSCAAADSQLAL